MALLNLVILLGACTPSPGPAVTHQVEIVRVFITATPVPTLRPSHTPTATSTPTPTPTPTPTAPGIGLAGNPRAYTLFDPLPQSGAPCGWADTLDFPLDPPDGESAYGGGDFGRYRSRYQKYHAGEDWGLSTRNNFGKPVYSIGHGQVTYAQPLGWGVDKGVVIVRHIFPDGVSLLSFYGHLDPPSVTIREGTCVARGDTVGQIGRPRTPPHLHFEIRTHMPYATGGGYWPSDPTNAGWLPPSQTINQYRLQTAPGVLWTDESEITKPLGWLDEITFLVIQDDRFVGIDLLNGDEIWSYELAAPIKDALLDPLNGVLYISESVDGLLAYPIPTIDEAESLPERLTPLWERRLPSSRRMDLMPLPDGGVLVSHKDTLTAFSSEGDLLWEEKQESYLASWALAEDALIFTSISGERPLMTADADGLNSWDESLSGIPLVADGQAWLYAKEGLYRLDLDSGAAQRVYDLPEAVISRSAGLSLSNGGLILLHSDTADRRLLAFDTGGELLWEFSVPLVGVPQLFELDGRVFLLTRPSFSGRGAFRTVEVYEVDLGGEQLFRIFEGGSRTFNPSATWAASVNGQKLLIQIGGIGNLLLDPKAAQERMAQ